MTLRTPFVAFLLAVLALLVYEWHQYGARFVLSALATGIVIGIAILVMRERR